MIAANAVQMLVMPLGWRNKSYLRFEKASLVPPRMSFSHIRDVYVHTHGHTHMYRWRIHVNIGMCMYALTPAIHIAKLPTAGIHVPVHVYLPNIEIQS